MQRVACIEHFEDCCGEIAILTNFILNMEQQIFYDFLKKMGEFGGQNAHSTLNTDCESGV